MCNIHPAVLHRFAAKVEGFGLLLQSDTVYPHSSYKPAPVPMTLHGRQPSIAMALAERMHNKLILGLENMSWPVKYGG